MQKVIYSIKKVNRDERIKGIGYLADGNLLIPAKAKNGNPFIRVFDDVSKHCTAVPDAENEYRGFVTVAYSDVQVYDKQKNNYKILDYVETTYYVWFKFVK